MALQPGTGGVFAIEITTSSSQPEGSSAPVPDASATATTHQRTLWDRKSDGGFPEAKELKRRVRDIIDPGRDLGHVDRDHDHEASAQQSSTMDPAPPAAQGTTNPPASASAGDGDGAQSSQAPLAALGTVHGTHLPPVKRWGSGPAHLVRPGGGGGGIKPQIRQPPATAQAEVERRLAESRQHRAEAEGHAGAETQVEAAAEPAVTAGEAAGEVEKKDGADGAGGEPSKCDDCE